MSGRCAKGWLDIRELGRYDVPCGWRPFQVVAVAALLATAGCGLFLRGPAPRADLGRWGVHAVALRPFADLTRQGRGASVARRFGQDLRSELGAAWSVPLDRADGLLSGTITSYRLSRDRHTTVVALDVRLWSRNGDRLLWSRHLAPQVTPQPGELPDSSLERAIDLAAKEFAHDFRSP